MSLLNTDLLLRFVALPLAVFAASRIFLRLSRHRFPPQTEIAVAQRAARAVVAMILAIGAVDALRSNPDYCFQLALARPETTWLIHGTLIFYLYDCVMLAMYAQWEGSMWGHHFAALALFSFSSLMEIGHGGCIMALLGEFLVPWGFMLFYLRALGSTKSTIFKFVCVGGMTTLVIRFTMWICILYIHNINSDNWSALPVAFNVIVNMALLIAVALEIIWFKLYRRNLSRALESESMGRRTPSMMQL